MKKTTITKLIELKTHKRSWLKATLLVMLLSLIQACWVPAFAQSSRRGKQQERVDFRVPSKTKIENYKKQSRFQYIEDPIEIQPQEEYQQAQPISPRSSSSVDWNMLLGGLTKWILIGGLVIFIVYLIFRYGKIDVFSKSYKKSVVDQYTESDLEEDIKETKFERLITQALANEDYRLAVRYLFLQNLQVLTEKELIEWRVNKTNHAYANELNNADLRREYMQTSLIFDYVWYGELTLDRAIYNQVDREMKTFYQTVSNYAS